MSADSLVQAKHALARGDLAEASARIDALLREFGNDPEVLYLGAVIRRIERQLPKAQQLLDQLIALRPELGRAYQERGHCLRQAGDRPGAVAAFEKAVACNPLLTVSWKLLADHYDSIDPAHAEECRKSIAEVESHPPELLGALAAYYDQDNAAAEERVRAYLRKAPTDPVAMRLLAELGTRLGEYEDAEYILEQCRELNPDYLPARFDYAVVLSKRFKFEPALHETEFLVTKDPSNQQYRMQRANLLLHVGRTDEAAAAYADLQAEAPDHPMIALTHGHALKTLGRVPEAIAAYRQAYAAQPDFGDAYWSLANLKTYRFEENEVAAMIEQEACATISTDDRIHMCFALGKALEDAGDHARSFEYYARGNALRQEVLGYRPETVSGEVDRQISACTPDLFAAKQGSGCQSPDPIFIVGLPRAGSTLLEQILASHSRVEGTSELPDMIAIASRLNGRQAVSDEDRYPAVLADLSKEQLTELGEGYIASTRVHRLGGQPRFIDKLPNNFRHIGLIHLILPNATIIDARRDPLDCSFSVFKQLFAQGQDFSYDLDHIGRYYCDYLRLMDHWHAVLPKGRILQVDHEAVIDDLEGQVRRILDYCGLPFEQACLDFHKSTRAVRTPSSEQVRRPINRDGAGVWRAYEPWLGPLKQALAARPELGIAP